MQHLDSLDFASKIKELIDSLKAICTSYGFITIFTRSLLYFKR